MTASTPRRSTLFVLCCALLAQAACGDADGPGHPPAQAESAGGPGSRGAGPRADVAATPLPPGKIAPARVRLDPLDSPFAGRPLGAEQPRSGPLRVAWLLPHGELDGALVGAVGFDRPMVPMATQRDDVSVPWLRFEPAIAVRARWVDARTLRFEARSPLPLATSWRLTVAGARSLDGATQTEPAQVSFHTRRLRVVGTWPPQGAGDVDRHHRIALHFDQGVSEARVRRALRVAAAGRALQGLSVRVPRVGELTRMLRPTGQRYLFGARLDKPRAAELRRLAGKVAVVELPPLELNTQVKLTLAKGLRGQQGPRGLARPYALTYRVHGAMRFLSGGCSGSCDPDHWRPVSFRVSTRVALPAKAARRGLVKLEPPAKRLSMSCWSQSCSIAADFAPDTAYTLTVSGDLADHHGQRLGRPAVIRFRTGHRRPVLNVLTEGSVLERSEAPWRWVVESRNQRDLRLRMKRLDESALRAWLLKPSAPALDDYDVDRLVAPGRADVVRRHAFDLQRELGGTPGLVYAELTAKAPPPKGRFRPRAPRVARLLQVTDLNLHLRESRAGGLAWLTSLSSGRAVASARVQVLDAKAGQRWQGTTDAKGLVRLPKLPEVAKGDVRVVIASAGGDRAMLRLNYATRLRGWASSASPLRHVLFSDKGLYKPGDVAHVKGVLRVLGPTGLALPKGVDSPTKGGAAKVRVQLRSPDGKLALTLQRPVSALGTFHADLPLPRDGRYGTWEAVVTWGEGYVMRQSLRVAVYRPARFTASLRTERRHVVQGDEVTAHVGGRWLSGGPMAGAKAAVQVDTQPGDYRPAGWSGWSFGNDTWEPGRKVATALRHEVAATLDRDGKWTGKFTARSGHIDPVSVLVETTLRGPSGHEGHASQRLWLHPASVTAAVRAERSFWRVDDTVTLRAAAADLKGVAQPGAPVRVRLVRRQYKRVRARRHGGTWEWETVAVDSEVGTCVTPTGDADKRTCAFAVDKPGSYIATATAQDSAGRVSRAVTGLWVTGAGGVAWHPEGERAPLLSVERSQWRVGEQARLLIRNPWPGASALLTVDRGGVRTTRTLSLPHASHQVTVPVTADLQPNCHVSLVVFRGRLKPGVGAQLDSGGPMVRAAAVELRVDTSSHKLHVTVRPDRKRYRPGDEVQLAFEVRDASGKPREAELAALVVDEGVLQLTGHTTPDPMAVLYRPVGHDVVDRSLLNQLVRRRVGEAKGDPGGGGDEGGALVRSNLKDVAWYAPAVKTDATGKALVRFRLPDNLTTFRVTAVAVAGVDAFGAGVGKLEVGKPLMVQLRPPRIAELGDHFELSAAVRNGSTKPVDATVTATVKGAKLAGPGTRTVRVPAGEAREVTFDIVAESVGTVTFAATAVGGGERDGVERTLRVVDRAPRDVVATHLVSETDVVEAVRRPKASRADVGGVQVSLSNTGLSTLRPGVDALLDYPFGCAEQTASRLMALAEVRRLKRTRGLFTERDDAELAKAAERAVARLLSLRVRWPRGLFRLWPGSRSGSDVALSAWVLRALKHAQQLGIAVPDLVFTEGAKALRKSLSRRPLTDRERDAAVAATLSHLGTPDHGTLANLWEARAKLSWVGQLHLADALLHSGKPTDRERAAQLVGGLLGQLRVEGSYATLPDSARSGAGLWGGGARVTAMTLHALAQTHPTHALADRLARGLLRQQRRGHWGSTQDNAWSLLGLSAHFGAVAPAELDFAVFVGKRRLGDGRIAGRAAVDRLFRLDQAALAEDVLTAVQVRRQGTGALFVGVRYEVVDPVAQGVARNNGFSVRRRVIDLQGATDRRSFKRGDYAVVTVTAWSGERRRQVAIRDPIPGGFEVVDFQLAERPRALQAALQRAGVGTSVWTHREVTPTDVRFFADSVPAGQHTWRYVVRAATRGSWRWPGADVHEMYDPEVRGRSASARVDIGG